MNKFRKRLWTYTLCMGIVMTVAISWFLGGPSGRFNKTEVPSSQPSKSATEEMAAAPQMTAQKKRQQAVDDAPRPFRQVALNLYQERLLKGAVMLDRRRIEPRGTEPAKEIRLWRTDFKYPLVREETTLGLDADGRLQPVRRDFSVADHAMVKFPEGVTPQQVSDWTQKHGFTLRHALKTTSVKLISAAEESLDTADQIMAAFRQAFPQEAEQASVAERDYLVFPTLLPDDTSFSQLWGMHNTGQTGGTADADIDAAEAWDLTTGSREVLIGVIDTGVDRTHPDLEPNMWRNPNEIAGNRVDDDRNGFIDDANGWDFFADDNDPMDENNHGTHCSGTMGGVGNNLSGVAGVCWQVSIVGIRFLGPSGGVTSDAIESVNYSRTLGVDLTSNSWGGGGFSALLQAAIVNAGQADQLFVAAAGNDGTDTDLFPEYPAGYAADNIISVAASTDRDARSSFSNYGRNSVDLAAPGSSILSTVRNGGYSTFSGTSMATPHVAGALALLKSLAPTMPMAEIKTQLLASVDPLPAFTSTTASGGRLNVARLIADSAGPRPIISVTTIEEVAGGNGDGISNPGEALALRFTVQNRGTELAQNVKATLTSSAKTSRYSITRGVVNLGNLVAGQLLESTTTFLVKSQALTLTPYAEEFQITLSYGPAQKQTVHRLTLYLYTSSRIAGKVTRVSDNSAISGATVILNGPTNRTVDTGADGRYTAVVTDGVYQIHAAALGFVPSLVVTKNAPPGAEGVDFALGIPQLKLTPTTIQAGLYVNRQASQLVQMRNDGTAPLTWSLKVNKRQSNAAASQIFYKLPEARINEKPQSLEAGSRSSFKILETDLAPALELPLDSLIGKTIGAVSTTWDRSILIGDLQSRGATVLTLNLPLTDAELESVDAIIVDDSIASFTASDLELLRARIMTGAGVLCEADNSSSMERVSELFRGTGIEAISESFRDLSFTDIRPHPMTLGVTKLQEFSVGASATITGSAQVLVQDPNGRSHAAITRLGAGVIVFVGNEISDSSNFESGDARRFVNQIMDGLVGNVSWLMPGAYSGYIGAGERYSLALEFSAIGQESGTYEAEVIFETNIPNEVDQKMAVTMIVSDAPQIVGSVDRIDFGSVVEGVVVNQTLIISNPGTLPLNVQRVTIAGPDAGYFSLLTTEPFEVLAKANQALVVGFDPAAPIRAHQAQLLIESNDPTLPAMIVPLMAVRQLPPGLSIKAKEVSMQLREGQSGSAEVALENRGRGPLSWRMSLPSAPAWVKLAGGRGRIFPRASAKNRLIFDTEMLRPGNYETTLEITTNDLVSPVTLLPIRLRVTAAPRLLFSQDVTFPNTIVGAQSQVSLPIINIGSADLVISTINAYAPSFTCLSALPFRVPAGQVRSLAIRFKPTKAGGAAGSLILGTNLPERFTFLVVSGLGIRGPTLQVTPASLSFSTAPGVTLERSILLTNKGDLPLNWGALLDDVSRFSLNNTAGALLPGQSQVITLKTTTDKMPAGVYNEKLTLESDDKKRPKVTIPIRMQVTRTGTLALSKPAINFDEIWTDAVGKQIVVLSNTGNIPFDILSVVPSSSRLTSDIVLPVQIGPGDEVPVTFSYSSAMTADFKDECKITTSIRSNRVVTLPVNANVVSPPLIDVKPSRVDETLDPGQLILRDITLKNDGGAGLTWTSSLIDGIGPELPLEEVLNQFNANTVLLQTKIPSTYSFPRGIVGDRIVETSPNGIFNGGNIHTTSAATGTTIPYSDNLLATHAGLGVSGTYFTRKTNTLFVFAADLEEVLSFKIQGQLSTGGAGRVEFSSITRMIAGKTYRGFLKQTFGLSKPAVHHLIIVIDKPGIDQRFPTDSTLDELEITGLSGKTRLYHLLFCTLQGRQVTEAEATRLMDSFLLTAVHPLTPAWLKLTPSTGTVAASSKKVHALQLDTRTLPGGSYGATVRFNSNAAGLSQIDLPVTVQVPSRFLLRFQPQPFVFPDTYVYAQAYQACEIANVGNLPVTLTTIRSSESTITSSGINLPKTLQPRETTTVNLLFNPKEVGDYSATITVNSAGTSEPALSMPVLARATLGPIIEASPTPINLTVDPGSTATETINIANKGGAVLNWTASSSSNLKSLTFLSRTSGATVPQAASSIVLSVLTTPFTIATTTSGSITLVSDDPRKPNVIIPVSITVRPIPRLTLSLPVATFDDTYLQNTATQSLTLRNAGNAHLTVSNIRSVNSQFSWAPISTPLHLSIGQSRTMTLTFTPEALGAYNSEIQFTTNQPSAAEVILSVLGRCVTPPMISVQPDEMAVTLPKGSSASEILTLKNQGGTTLNWQTVTISPTMVTGTLQDILQNVNDHHSEITALLPDFYAFMEGDSGSSISDGGNDMYDTGNILGTNFRNSIIYSNNQITSGAGVGSGGRYFTSKKDGLFIFAADLDGVTSFSISGDLGADGYGLTDAAVLTRTIEGITYKGFFKSVHGTSDPSVNHLIILEDKPMITNTYSSNTNLDDHSVKGLSGSTRLYYLLFARANGAAVSSAVAQSIMDLFLSKVALPNSLPWVTPTPISGNTISGASSTVSLKLDTIQMDVGTHVNAVLRFTSNAANASILDVPVSLHVTARPLEVSPTSFNAIQIQGQGATPQTISLTALPGTQPAWAAKSNAAWMSLSKISGTGNDRIQVTYDPALPEGNYSSTISISYPGVTIVVPVTLNVRAAGYTQLLTDYERPRMLGVIRGLSAASSMLVDLHPSTLKVQNILNLPTDVTDADITTDGRLLYAISFAGRTISEVDLETFTLRSSRSIPTPADAGTTAPYHYHIEAGRPGIVYYTDAATNPKLHVFDYNAGTDLSTFTLSSGAGIGDFVVTPNGSTIYAWSQIGWNNAGTSALVRLSCGSDTLTMTGQSSVTLSQAPLDAPVLYTAGRAAVITKNYQFAADLSTSQSQIPPTFYAASAYGNALAGMDELTDSETGAVLKTYSAKNGVIAFTGDQKALIYLHRTLSQLIRLDVPNLSSTDLSPRLPDGGVLAVVPSSLIWNGSPVAASYDVYLGTDPVAVAAANNQASGTAYLGNTPAASFSINPSTLQLGLTYYWRIDIRNLDNSTVKGSIWSFRLPAVTSTSQSLSAAALKGSTGKVQTPLSIMTAQSDTPWTLFENSPWLSLEATAGTGPVTLSLTLDPKGLVAASNVASLILSSGADTVNITVTLRLLGTLNIIKMEADPSIQRVYALHADTSSPSEAWLLWINPLTAQIDHLLPVGNDASDFAVHVGDDRVYILTQNGTRIVTVGRQPPQQLLRTLILASPVVALHNGPVGRLIVRSSANVLQMLNSSSGVSVGSAINLPASITRTSGSGTQLFAAVQQSSSITGIQRYTLSTSGISYSTANYWNGILGSRFVLSGNGERAFYNQAAYSVSGSIVQTSAFPAVIVASSWNGQMAFSDSSSHSTTAQSEVLASIPFKSDLMAATADQSRLVLFSPLSRTFSSIDPGALSLAPAIVSFGIVPLGSNQSMNVTVSNLTSQDLTLNLSSTEALFKVPSTPVTINAGQFAQIAISAVFNSIGNPSGTLKFTVNGQAQFSRTTTVSAQVITTNPVTVDFSTGAPADNSQISSASYAEDGLVFSTPNQILRIGANHINRPNNGTPHIAPLSNQRPLSIKRSDNGIFHLYSVDLAEHSYLSAMPKTITFNGVKSSGSSVTTSFLLDGITDSTGPQADFQTFTFPSNFRDLLSAEVTVDVYAMDNLVFEPGAGASVSTASVFVTNEASLDLDSDGKADVWIIDSDSRIKDSLMTQHRFTYMRRLGIQDSAVTLQASLDGQTWTSLTFGIDYTIEELQQDQDSARETVRLMIPTATGASWQFRLISTP